MTRFDLDGVRLELEGLLCLRRENELAADYEGRADVLAGDLVIVGQALTLEHDPADCREPSRH